MATPTTLPASFTSGQVLTAAQMNNLRGAFRVLQVVNTIKSDTFVSGSVSQGGSTDITGMTASITPSSTSSKVLVTFSVYGQIYIVNAAFGAMSITCSRGATLIGVGDAAGSRTRVTGQNGIFTSGNGFSHVAASILDSPNTTSTTTYKLSCVHTNWGSSAGSFYINRAFDDGDASSVPRAASFMTLMEISA